MQESLTASRNVHHVLILISTVVSIFGLSIVPKEDKFEEAVKELDSFLVVQEKTQAARFAYLQKAVLGA